MGLKLNTASGGSVSIEPTNTASNYTLTVPAQTGTVSLDGPAFSAYQSSGQTVSATTWTKLQIQTEEFDTASCFDSTTNYRFTPTVAGYYQISGGYTLNTTNTYCKLALYKNGSNYKFISNGYSSTQGGAFGSCLVYLNGSTDYIELYAEVGATNVMATGSANYTYFQGSMVRTA